MDYFVPSLLNDLVGEAERDARAVLDLLANTPDGGIVDPGALVLSDPQARQKLERDRKNRFALMLETLTDKYDNAVRTSVLMEDIAAGRCSFVLFLRGFSQKETYELTGRYGYEADLGEYQARFDLAAAIAPVPTVIVRNPATSESLVGVFKGAEKAAATTYAIDLDDTWERAVESLVRTASYIVVRNAIPGSGLDAELAMLRKHDRLNDTFFSNPENAPASAGSVAQALDDNAYGRMHASKPRPVPPGVALPSPPTCLWIQGQRRRTVGENVFFIFDYLNSLSTRGQSMPRDLQGRLLFSTVAASVGIERLDLLIATLSSYVAVVGQYRPDELPDPNAVLRDYGNILNSVAGAIDSAGDTGDVLDFRDFTRLRELMVAGEDPERLIHATMRVVRRMQVRFRLPQE